MYSNVNKTKKGWGGSWRLKFQWSSCRTVKSPPMKAWLKYEAYSVPVEVAQNTAAWQHLVWVSIEFDELISNSHWSSGMSIRDKTSKRVLKLQKKFHGSASATCKQSPTTEESRSRKIQHFLHPSPSCDFGKLFTWKTGQNGLFRFSKLFFIQPCL